MLVRFSAVGSDFHLAGTRLVTPTAFPYNGISLSEEGKP